MFPINYRILKLLSQNSNISISLIHRHLNISEYEADKSLTELVKLRLITQTTSKVKISELGLKRLELVDNFIKETFEKIK